MTDDDSEGWWCPDDREWVCGGCGATYDGDVTRAVPDGDCQVGRGRDQTRPVLQSSRSPSRR